MATHPLRLSVEQGLPPIDISALESQIGHTLMRSTLLGLIVTDISGRVIWTNQQAKAILEPSIGLLVDEGILSAARYPERRRLQEFISATVIEDYSEESTRRLMFVSRRDGQLRQFLQFLPVSFDRGFEDRQARAALVVVKDITQSSNRFLNQAQRLYELTDAECRVVEGMLQGRSVLQISTNLKRSVSTIRSELKNIFRKMDIGRQSEAIRALLSLPGFELEDSQQEPLGEEHPQE